MKLKRQGSIVIAALLLLAGGLVYHASRVADPPLPELRKAPADGFRTTETATVSATNARSNVPATGPLEATRQPAATIAPERADGLTQPIGYAGPERWKATPVPCWGLRGTAPEDFEVTADRETNTAGQSSIALSSRRSEGWGTLYQFADAVPMRSKRIELTADIRTRDVERSAGLYVRIDAADGTALAIDNMWYAYGERGAEGGIMNRSLSGDNEWTSTTIVMDVPADAHAFSYGLYLDGPGKAWLDNAHFEVVSGDTPVTGFVRTPSMLEGMAAFRLGQVPPMPVNLDFEPAANCARE